MHVHARPPRRFPPLEVSKHHPKIKILNPMPGSYPWTLRHVAERHIRQQRAVMEHGCLRFLDASERHQATVRHDLQRFMAKPAPDPITSTGLAHLNQVQRLPCAGPAIKVFTLLSKRGPGFQPTYT